MVLTQILSLHTVPRLQLGGRGTATLYPDTFKYGSRSASAENALDGKSNIGSSAGDGVLLCASTELYSKAKTSRMSQYLRIHLLSRKRVHFVRLQMRDGIHPREHDGLTVGTGPSQNLPQITQCGSAYKYDQQGQSPVFSCSANGLYVWILFRTTYRGISLQVCEVEVYATGRRS